MTPTYHATLAPLPPHHATPNLLPLHRVIPLLPLIGNVIIIIVVVIITIIVLYKIIEVCFWLLLDPFLAANRYFTLSSWLCARAWSLLLSLVILCFRWSWIQLWSFLGYILGVLVIEIILTFCVGCVLSHHLRLFWSVMCFVRLPLLLIFWLIRHVLTMSIGASLVPRIFPLAYLVFFIWMLSLFLMSSVSIDGFLFFYSFLALHVYFHFLLKVLIYVPLFTYSFQFFIFILQVGVLPNLSLSANFSFFKKYICLSITIRHSQLL